MMNHCFIASVFVLTIGSTVFGAEFKKVEGKSVREALNELYGEEEYYNDEVHYDDYEYLHNRHRDEEQFSIDNYEPCEEDYIYPSINDDRLDISSNDSESSNDDESSNKELVNYLESSNGIVKKSEAIKKNYIPAGNIASLESKYIAAKKSPPNYSRKKARNIINILYINLDKAKKREKQSKQKVLTGDLRKFDVNSDIIDKRLYNKSKKYIVKEKRNVNKKNKWKSKDPSNYFRTHGLEPVTVLFIVNRCFY
jgi:signal peptidase I